MAASVSKIHPTVDRIVRTTINDSFSPTMAGFDDESRRAMTHYWRLHQARLWPNYGLALLALFSTIGMIAAFTEGPAWAQVLATTLFAVSTLLTIVKKGEFKPTDEELASISPALRLSPIQRAYLDAILVLRGLNLPAETVDELIAQLEHLVDEEARLLTMKERGSVRAIEPSEIEAERQALLERIALATDAPTREALEIGLRTCERRLASAQHLALASQRVDAQLEMIHQTIRGVRDGLLSLHLAPGASALAIDLDPIRQTLDHVQNHTAAIEAALSEVQTLEAKG